MKPRPGEVFMLDLGYEGKVRPVVIVSREDDSAHRALAVFVPLTTEFRSSRYEVKIPRVPWLAHQSFANAQAMGAAEYHELTDRRGRLEPAVMAEIKAAIRWALDL